MPQPHIPMRHVPQDGHDSMSIVDNRLKVYGIEKLRIADGSIMSTASSTPSDARLGRLHPRGLRKSMPDTLLFLNARTNSSRWLPNSCFNSAIEIHSVRKDVSILGQRPLLEDQDHLYQRRLQFSWLLKHRSGSQARSSSLQAAYAKNSTGLPYLLELPGRADHLKRQQFRYSQMAQRSGMRLKLIEGLVDFFAQN
jgi:hypothetical protein